MSTEEEDIGEVVYLAVAISLNIVVIALGVIVIYIVTGGC